MLFYLPFLYINEKYFYISVSCVVCVYSANFQIQANGVAMMRYLHSIKSKLIAGLSLSMVCISTSLFAATPLVSPNWLAENLTDENVVVIDLRNKIDEGSYETFLQGHVPGSVHSDYLKDGWRVGKDDVVGLLPSEAEFQQLARKLGVSQDSHVVLVPAGVSATDFGSSARAYWTFKTFGHDNVSILNGGFNAWKAAYPEQIGTSVPETPKLGDFVATFKEQGYVDANAISQRVSTGSGAILLDGRTDEQFYGTAKHPKARTHGRIPGAVLHSQSLAYDVSSNALKGKDELAEIYGNYTDEAIISYCNTGHWAATNWFVLSEVLGNKQTKLYDGSMVEWSSDDSNPLETGKSNLDRIKGLISKITG